MSPPELLSSRPPSGGQRSHLSSGGKPFLFSSSPRIAGSGRWFPVGTATACDCWVAGPSAPTTQPLPAPSCCLQRGRGAAPGGADSWHDWERPGSGVQGCGHGAAAGAAGRAAGRAAGGGRPGVRGSQARVLLRLCGGRAPHRRAEPNRKRAVKALLAAAGSAGPRCSSPKSGPSCVLPHREEPCILRICYLAILAAKSGSSSTSRQEEV